MDFSKLTVLKPCRSIKTDMVLCHARLLVQAPYSGAQRR